ncbi:hypothetical protein BGZ99_000749 [Dissophora globulifera]|uniref:Dynein light intermediate chain n=1 Tax=Dissophora globulifera TaxID=979702 RepID=A0A9P6R0G4_9FUNG|nr:hypothetical protein BGZ99_000749 [Dissophora globulifera]
MAGSNKSYHPLLKYCLNTNTTADSAVIIVLDWSKPWTFMETLQRWARVLDVALQQILQEGAVATATWTKGKALLEELQEKLSRFLQEYTEPQPHAANGAVAYSESQTFNLGSTDAQSVLLPLTEGCLTNNTGLPLVIVCTKSDYINNLEREMDYKEETFDYIQQSLRTICLKYGASLFYTSIHHPHTFADLRQYLLHRLLTPSTLSSTHQQQQQQQQQPSSFPFRMRAQVVERDQVMVPAGWDSMGKIKVLRNGFDCEGVAEGWDMDMKNAADGATDAARLESGARQVYEEVIINPKRNLAPVTIQPLITAEEDQVFLEQFLETLQRTASDRTGISAMGGAGMGSRSTAPPVVGPLSSGYTSMLNSHHSSPPPGMSTVPHSVGSAGGRAGANGYDSDEVERLKGFRSQKSSKVNGGIGGGSSTSRLIGPALTEGDIGGGLSSAKYNGRSPPTSGTGSNNSGLSAASLKAGMTAGGAGAGVGGAGTAGVGQRLGGAGVAGTIGGSSVAANQAETAKITSFFQSLMSKNSGAGGAGLGRMGSMTLDGSTSPSGGAGAAGGNDA